MTRSSQTIESLPNPERFNPPNRGDLLSGQLQGGVGPVVVLDDRAHSQVRRRVDEPVYRHDGVVVRCVASSVALFSRVGCRNYRERIPVD